LLPTTRSRTPSPHYRTAIRRSPSPPSPSSRYASYRKFANLLLIRSYQKQLVTDFFSTPSPQPLSEEDEPMSSSVRQRRLPLIGSIPRASLLSPNSNEYYAGSMFPPPQRFRRPPPPPSTYCTPPTDIPSPSPASSIDYQLYAPNIHAASTPRLSPGYRRPGYFGDGAPPFASTTSTSTGARVSGDATSRTHTRIIQAQPANVPLSDSDNDDEPKWAIV
uniref:Velvet domain-containing protein n=1 Tax=Anisakis simplex TaxID=6269 RepID=A0A0M3J540_ANISI